MHEDYPLPTLTPKDLAEHVARNAPRAQQTQHDHVPAMESVRRATYRGYTIVIRTTYTIEVDGVPLEGHLAVTNDGRVHYHAIPNLALESAVDLVKLLIDTFPADFRSRSEAGEHGEEHEHGSDSEEHRH